MSENTFTLRTTVDVLAEYQISDDESALIHVKVEHEAKLLLKWMELPLVQRERLGAEGQAFLEAQKDKA